MPPQTDGIRFYHPLNCPISLPKTLPWPKVAYVGMVTNLIIGFIYILQGFRLNGGMTIPNIGSLDPGTYVGSLEGKNWNPRYILISHIAAN